MRILKRVIAVFIVVLTAFLLVSKAKAADNNTKVPTGSSSDIHDYDNDINRWQEFTYTLEKLESYTQNYSLPTKGEDTKIDKIIPVDCFAIRGTHVHIGIKYGFCVYTSKKSTNVNKSEVFIFKITRSINKNPENLNGEVVDYTKNNTLTYALFTQFRPVLSNNYTYTYKSSNDSYKIESLQTNNDIAINYANQYISYGLSNSNSDDYSYKDWIAIRGKYSGKNEYIYDAVEYGIDVIIDAICIYLEYFTPVADAADFIKDALKGTVNIIFAFLKGESKEQIIHKLGVNLTKTLSNLFTEEYALKLAADLSILLVDVIEDTIDYSENKLPSIVGIADSVSNSVDSIRDAGNFLAITVKEGSKMSFVNKFISKCQDGVELITDCVCIFISIWNACHNSSSQTLSNVYYGKSQCGTPGDNELMVKAEKNDRISFYTHYTFDTDDTWRGGRFETRTRLEFRRAKGKYAEAQAYYKISLYDNYDFDKDGNPINHTICHTGYTWEDHTYKIDRVTYSDMEPYHYVYFKPVFDASYVFTVESEDGQKCSFNTIFERDYYKLRIYTGEIKGNHQINMTVRGVTNVITKTTSFKCEKSGNYLFRIDASKSDIYYELTSVTYSQTYYFTSYHYTVTSKASFKRYDAKQFLVFSLEAGKTYSVTYKCDCEAQLRPSYTIITS